MEASSRVLGCVLYSDGVFLGERGNGLLKLIQGSLEQSEIEQLPAVGDHNSDLFNIDPVNELTDERTLCTVHWFMFGV